MLFFINIEKDMGFFDSRKNIVKITAFLQTVNAAVIPQQLPVAI